MSRSRELNPLGLSAVDVINDLLDWPPGATEGSANRQKTTYIQAVLYGVPGRFKYIDACIWLNVYGDTDKFQRVKYEDHIRSSAFRSRDAAQEFEWEFQKLVREHRRDYNKKDHIHRRT